MKIIVKLLKFFNLLPEEGSQIMYVQKLQCETITYKGVLHYHDDGTNVYIKTPTCTLCSISVKSLI